MEKIEFHTSKPFTIGVELELQIVNRQDYNLTRGSDDLLSRLEKTKLPGEVKPEITESMIELNSSVQTGHAGVLQELLAWRDEIGRQAEKLNLGISGGGTHPFHTWSDRRIYPTDRFNRLHEMYGFLSKQFTVFGQHIHIGVANGDDALYLTHALARYIPHFIALSACSPFSQSVDTAFMSARLSAVKAFPLSGICPFLLAWDDFSTYFHKMKKLAIIESMKDFYWDIRPKPEYGTVEIRVCDTPLTVERAALLAGYAQALAGWLLIEREQAPHADVYLPYNYNHFQACRYGLNGMLIDAYSGNQRSIREDILDTLIRIARHAAAVGAPLDALRAEVEAGRNIADWVREKLAERGSLPDVVQLASEIWMGRVEIPDFGKVSAGNR